MIIINETLSIEEQELELTAIRSQGKGGQNVNKVSTAIQLRFSIPESSLPEPIKDRLLKKQDKRITKEGILVIKAQNHRTQDRNRAEAIERLTEMIKEACIVPKKRRPTRPGRAAKKRRLEKKRQQSEKKALRGKVQPE